MTSVLDNTLEDMKKRGVNLVHCKRCDDHFLHENDKKSVRENKMCTMCLKEEHGEL